jgi:hypothetical protein
LIQAPDLLVMPGIFDGFSARLVEQTGFAAGFISGGGLSETLLGYSDVGLMGFELNLAAVTRLAACCTLSLLADADTGYGNAVNVYHTTRAFEQAGVAWRAPALSPVQQPGGETTTACTVHRVPRDGVSPRIERRPRCGWAG